MLSETDIHYVTGFLYVLTRREDISIVLGEKVFDEASESRRDVDIVIATAGEHGLAGIEVKDEGRPLHVGLVEGICQKFADMPSITRRSIVSASGYTAPALKKAAAHGVQCLKIVRGKVPQFATIDLSHITEIPVSYLEWREGPHVVLPQLSEAQRSEICALTPVVLQFGKNEPSEIRTLRDLFDQITAKTTSEWAGPEVQPGNVAVSIDVEITDQPILALASGSVTVTDARVTGVVEWVTSIPTNSACYLATPEGEPVAGAVLFQLRSGLAGLAVGSSSQELRLFHVPNALRIARPVKKRIFGSDEGTQ
jgi:hypothetical protein